MSLGGAIPPPCLKGKIVKKYILILSVLLLAVPAFAQTIEPGSPPAKLSFLVGFGGWSGDDFSNIGGAMHLGGQYLVDADYNFNIRAEYNRLNVGAPARQSVALSGVWYWYLGQKWNFGVNPGVDFRVTGEGGNPMFFGGTLEHLVFKVKDENARIPFYGTAYGSINFFEEAIDVRVGIRISYPEKR